MTRRAAVLLILVALTLPAAAADGFKSVVKGIEKHYGIKRLHPHLIGFTMFVAKPFMWGSGAGGLKVAVFESDEGREFRASPADLERIMAESLGGEWQPFVRVHSRRDGEATTIYAQASGKRMRMIIATVESDEIAVVQLNISAAGITKWIEDPEGEARSSAHHDRQKSRRSDKDDK